MNIKTLETKVVNMLQALEHHPELYKQSDPSYHNTARAVKQKTWDQIAVNSGFAKTEDAKCRWRGLLLYFRQTLEDVAKKKVRRYIPNTGNPEDKYVQLTDWRYYKYIKFMEPNIKISSNLTNPRLKADVKDVTKNNTQLPEMLLDKPADNLNTSISEQNELFKKVFVLKKPKAESAEPSAALSEVPTLKRNVSTISQKQTMLTTPKYLHRKVKIGNVIMDIKINSKTNSADVSMKNQNGTTTSTTLPITMSSPTAELSAEPTSCDQFTAPQFENLSNNDQNLKSFFDSMLKSTQRLPAYHQERVKRKLMDAIRKKTF